MMESSNSYGFLANLRVLPMTMAMATHGPLPFWMANHLDLCHRCPRHSASLAGTARILQAMGMTPARPRCTHGIACKSCTLWSLKRRGNPFVVTASFCIAKNDSHIWSASPMATMRIPALPSRILQNPSARLVPCQTWYTRLTWNIQMVLSSQVSCICKTQSFRFCVSFAMFRIRNGQHLQWFKCFRSKIWIHRIIPQSLVSQFFGPLINH